MNYSVAPVLFFVCVWTNKRKNKNNNNKQTIKKEQQQTKNSNFSQTFFELTYDVQFRIQSNRLFLKFAKLCVRNTL